MLFAPREQTLPLALLCLSLAGVNAKSIEPPQMRNSHPRVGAGWDLPRHEEAPVNDEGEETLAAPSPTLATDGAAARLKVDDYLQQVIRHKVPTQRILAIYTGGTLGMVKREGTWAPPERRGTLASLIESMSEFHDNVMPVKIPPPAAPPRPTKYICI